MTIRERLSAVAVLLLLAGCAMTGRHPACNDRVNRCVQACPSAPREPYTRAPVTYSDPRSLCEQTCAEEGRSCEVAETRREQAEAEQAASKLPTP